jgi:predicted PurR-regulated permease PerM
MANQRSTSPLFVLVAMIAVVVALHLAKDILLPLALAILFSFLLTPIANRLERWGLPRVPAVILVVALAFAPLAVLGWVVTHQLIGLSHTLPQYRERVTQNVVEKVRAIMPDSGTVSTVSETIEDVSNELAGGVESGKKVEIAAATAEQQAPAEADAAQREPSAADELDPPPTTSIPRAGGERDTAVPVKLIEIHSPLAQVRDWLGPLVAPLTTAGMVVVLVLFMLLDREGQRNRLLQLFGKSNLHLTTEAFHDAAQRVGRYLRMLFLVNMGYGVAVAAGLWMIGVPSAIMWGFLGFALRFLPYVGPWLAASMPILVSFAVFEGWTQPLLVMGLYIVVELVLNNVVEPLLYGGSIGVSSVAVILAAIFWTWIWGPIGLVLAMPMTVCLVVMSHYIPQMRFIHILLADQPPLTPSERVYQRLLAFDENEPMRVARGQLKNMPLVSFYDDVFIPALVLAERDRHTGVLNEDQEEFVQEASAELVDELGEAAIASDADEAASEAAGSDGISAEANSPDARILCIPLRDKADELASKMLAQLLTAQGFQVDTDAADALTSEVVDHVAKLGIDVVVISILPPIAPRDARLLWKRLRSRYPELPIIVGYWSGSAVIEPLMPPEHDSATKIATKLSDAVALVRSLAAQRRPVDVNPPQETRAAAG